MAATICLEYLVKTFELIKIRRNFTELQLQLSSLTKLKDNLNFKVDCSLTNSYPDHVKQSFEK